MLVMTFRRKNDRDIKQLRERRRKCFTIHLLIIYLSQLTEYFIQNRNLIFQL